MPTTQKNPEPRTRAVPVAAVVPLASIVIKDRAVVAAAEEFVATKAKLDLLEGRLKELKPVLEAAMNGSPIAYAGNRVLERTDVAASPATPNVLITKAMVGSVIPGKPGRKGYTQLKVR